MPKMVVYKHNIDPILCRKTPKSFVFPVRALDLVVFGFWFAPNLLPKFAAFVPKHTSIQAGVKGCRPICN